MSGREAAGAPLVASSASSAATGAASATATATLPRPSLELDIGGMSCAACANAIERQLNKLDGVDAVVNLATDRASVTGLGPEDADTAIAAVVKAGYTAVVHNPDDDAWTRRAAEVRLSSLRRRLAVAALLTVPLGDVSILLALLPAWRFPGWQALCVLLALPIVSWAAWPFHRAAYNGIRHGNLSMDTLVSLGTVVSFVWAVATVIFPSEHAGYWLGFGRTPPGADAIYLDVAAGLVTFQLAGRYFETRSRQRAGDVLGALSRLAVRQVRILFEADSGAVSEGRVAEERIVPVEQLSVGQRFVVLPGERVVADGRVTEGESTIDVAAMTGEALPQDAAPGTLVSGGTTNLTGRIVVEATAVGPRTRLAQLAAMAEEAQRRKARVQRLVDRVTSVFVPVVIGIAVVVLLGWLLFGAPFDRALANGVAVLIIACPCALGLATPTALMVGVGRGGQLGILIKSQDALEASGRIDTVVFDKTGTLTTGRFRVTAVGVAGGAGGAGTAVAAADPDAVLALAAAVEAGSQHPIALGILEAAAELGRPTAAVKHRTLPGLGASAVVDGAEVVVGRRELLETRGITLGDTPDRGGDTVVHVASDGRAIGWIALADSPREHAAEALDALRSMGFGTVMLTGDAAPAAAAVAGALGIREVRAGLLPTEKAAAVETLRAEGRRVAMVGDGINDAAALAGAELGIALVQGTDVAMKAADVIVVREDLRAVVDAVRLSRATLRTIRMNLVWAFVYNVAAIPLAAAGLLNPLISAAAMACSSVFVVTNSLRLRNFRPLD